MKIGIIGNTVLTKKAILKLIEMEKNVSYVFGLKPEALDSKVNSCNLKDLCDKNNIEFDCSGNWTKLIEKELDLVIVMGDSRMVPKEVLETNYVIGNHGAVLPFVQGAATLVWAKMLNLGYWGVSIFELKEKVDSGDILCTDTFEYTSNCTMSNFVEKADNLTIKCLEKVISGNYKKAKNKKFDLKISKYTDSEKAVKILKNALDIGMCVYMPPRTPRDSKVKDNWSKSFIEIFKAANNSPYPKWHVSGENI